MSPVNPSPPRDRPSFVDLFSGCGGLSLGLLAAGWEGVFAIERNLDAFETYRASLLSRPLRYPYRWPSWLPVTAHDIREVLERYATKLLSLRGQVDLLAGGPPCQGFSMAGRRRAEDPRNRLFVDYLRFVEALRPRFVLFENVRGIAVAHEKSGTSKAKATPFLQQLLDGLEALGYSALEPAVIRAVDLGVPQRRPRVFVVAVNKESGSADQLQPLQEAVSAMRGAFLRDRGLPIDRPVTVGEAISDLERNSGVLYECDDPRSPKGFLTSRLRKCDGPYQRLMRGQARTGTVVNSHRFARHSEEIEDRFRRILRTARRGVSLRVGDLATMVGTRKQVLVALDREQAAHTVTTLPDDMIHYCEPRILTVREIARLQSFPDWFEFRGNFTTGGKRRVHQAPRYTQVGNAVAPLVAEALGKVLLEYLSAIQGSPLEQHGAMATGS